MLGLKYEIYLYVTDFANRNNNFDYNEIPKEFNKLLKENGIGYSGPILDAIGSCYYRYKIFIEPVQKIMVLIPFTPCLVDSVLVMITNHNKAAIDDFRWRPSSGFFRPYDNLELNESRII